MPKERQKYIIYLLNESIYLLRQNKIINVFEHLKEIIEKIENEKPKR